MELNKDMFFDDDLVFYKTKPSSCPYLSDLQETKVLTNLVMPDAEQVYSRLIQMGFRRSQTLAYRPICGACRACQSIRIMSYEFKANKTQKRLLNLNQHLVRYVVPPILTQRHYDLYQKYIHQRHASGEMAQMSFDDVQRMVENTTIDTVIVEYRSFKEHDLWAWVLTDNIHYGLSMVYSVFDPDYPKHSLGNYVILDHIQFTNDLAMPYLYLGYWVKECQKMAYKINYYPHELYFDNKWQRFDKKDRKTLYGA